MSSDVYEWRKPGIDGCDHVQGCLALITNGRGGFMNIPLGTDASGRDVFFYTNSKLGPNDNDAAGDIYDARIDGGEPRRAAAAGGMRSGCVLDAAERAERRLAVELHVHGPRQSPRAPSATTGDADETKAKQSQEKGQGEKERKEESRAGEEDPASATGRGAER